MSDRRRPASDQPQRNAQLNLRVSAAEKAELQQRALDAGLDTTAFIRKRCLGRAGPRAVQTTSVELVALRCAMTDMGRLSPVLHGLHRIAVLGEIPGEREIAEACAEHRMMLVRLFAALGRVP